MLESRSRSFSRHLNASIYSDNLFVRQFCRNGPDCADEERSPDCQRNALWQSRPSRSSQLIPRPGPARDIRSSSPVWTACLLCVTGGCRRKVDGTAGLPSAPEIAVCPRAVTLGASRRLVPVTSLGSSAADPPISSRQASGIPCSGTHPAGLDGSRTEATHETRKVDSGSGRLRRGTGGRDPLSCRLCRTARTMSKYRDRG